MEVESNPWHKLRCVLKSSPILTGVTTDTISWPSAANVIDYAKKLCPSTLLVAGGPHMTLFASESLLSSSLDVAVRGEGEIALRRLACAVRDSKDWRGIASTTFRDNKKVITVSGDDSFPDIDNLFPSWQLFPLNKYYSVTSPGNILSVVSARGCPFKCSFCSQGYSRYTVRNPESVAREMKSAAKIFRAGHIVVFDETFGVDKARAIETAKRIQGHDLSWDVRIRADIIDHEIASSLRKSGCRLIHIGAESASPRILHLMNKEITPDDTVNALEICRQCSLPTRGYFMLGYPGETFRESAKTVSWAMTLPLNWASFSIAMPLPATQMEDQLVKAGKINRNFWSSRTLERKDYFPSFMSAGSHQRLVNLRRLAYFRFYTEPVRLLSLIRVIPPGRLINSFSAMLSLMSSDPLNYNDKSVNADLPGITE